MNDPVDSLQWRKLARPPSRGRGSGMTAWVEYGLTLSEANQGLRRVIEEQSAAIRALRGEVELLKRQVAERRPKGGRAPLPEETVARIEDEIAQGGSDRGIAARYRVSHMTVYRVRRRMWQRQLAAPDSSQPRG
jgi:DNA invertase Pin-like site-specific DNA recombinase